MTTAEMRRQLESAYPGMKWRLKVAAMPENQVFATYTRLKQAGRI